MTITIKSTASKSISVNQGASTQTGVVIKKNDAPVKLESITNVSSVGLSDGDSLVYNAITQKWETKPVSLDLGSIDGGTY